jgi:chromosome segregation protein
MRLNKIKLAGFKTFVDPTVISFPSNLMGIVGPNGCGKSNVIDAIRWVLGESSAKTLRGESMADVIFNGSGGRKPVGQASVELVFDNSDGTISGPYAGYSEVALRRIVTRDGMSQYFLNNARCRRKDITHILLGTGLGTHGYSIIEQGMISRLVEAKPEDLRAFLEEAAGISKYKERRRETEHRIRHTKENLERLTDLRDEVEKQLAHLQRQARSAERYKELKSEQRRVGAELLALRLRALTQAQRSQESILNEQQVALDSAIAEQRSVEASIEKLRIALTDRNDEFNAVQGDYYKVGAEIARLEQSIQHRKELGQRQREDLEATEQHLDELKSHIESDQSQIEEFNRLLSELNPELERAHASLRASEHALQDAEDAVEGWRADWAGVTDSLAEVDRQAEVEKTRISQTTSQIQRVERDLERLSAERDTLSTDEVQQQLDSLIGEEEALRAMVEAAGRELQTTWQSIQSLRLDDQRLNAEVDELRSRLQEDRGRLMSLEALQESALGKASEQVNEWLAAQDLHDNPRLAQQLDVDAGWERAVETVLGSYLQAVCVDDIDVLVDRLASSLEGGVILLSAQDGTDVASGGAADWLSSRVRGPAIARLLRGIRIAESLHAAVAIRRELGPDESVVTREGVWLGRSWLRINRSDDPHVGVLARGEEIKRLQASVTATTAQLRSVEDALGATRLALAHREEAHANAQTALNEHQQRYASLTGGLETARERLEQMRSRVAGLSREIDELSEERRELSESLASSERQAAALAARRTDLERRRTELEEVRESTRAALTEARERAEEHRALTQEMAIKVESRRSSKESAAAALQRVQSQQEHLLRRRRELTEQLETASQPLLEEERRLVSLLDERLGVEAKLAAARTAMDVADTELRDVELKRTEKQQLVSEARDVLDNTRLGVREAQVRADSVKEQFKQTRFDLDETLASLPDDATLEVWDEQFESLERRIQRLGAINLAAIDEYKEQADRKEYLDAQNKDLTEALDTLEAAIKKIDRETRSRFQETFDKANTGLARLFPQLFGGGHAYLELDGDDLLSSGVTVMARPPGKRNSTIHLLSGGEKALTAVALVFAIFELNPAPFCLLDEVDAPLDDANVGRFSEIVKQMSLSVQFVLITHNKVTMEAMKQLTGVTMNEPGVSRLVAVDIDEAVQLAAM